MEFEFEADIQNRIEKGKVLITTDPIWFIEKELTKTDIIKLCDLYGVTGNDLV